MIAWNSRSDHFDRFDSKINSGLKVVYISVEIRPEETNQLRAMNRKEMSESYIWYIITRKAPQRQYRGIYERPIRGKYNRWILICIYGMKRVKIYAYIIILIQVIDEGNWQTAVSGTSLIRTSSFNHRDEDEVWHSGLFMAINSCRRYAKGSLG